MMRLWMKSKIKFWAWAAGCLISAGVAIASVAYNVGSYKTEYLIANKNLEKNFTSLKTTLDSQALDIKSLLKSVARIEGVLDIPTTVKN